MTVEQPRTIAEKLEAFPTLEQALAYCPERESHADAPWGYLQWHAWAEEMKKTHRQKRCEGCGRFLVVVPK